MRLEITQQHLDFNTVAGLLCYRGPVGPEDVEHLDVDQLNFKASADARDGNDTVQGFSIGQPPRADDRQLITTCHDGR